MAGLVVERLQGHADGHCLHEVTGKVVRMDGVVAHGCIVPVVVWGVNRSSEDFFRKWPGFTAQQPAQAGGLAARLLAQDAEIGRIREQGRHLPVLHSLAFRIGQPTAPKGARFRTKGVPVPLVGDGGVDDHGWIVPVGVCGVNSFFGFFSVDGAGVVHARIPLGGQVVSECRSERFLPLHGLPEVADVQGDALEVV